MKKLLFTIISILLPMWAIASGEIISINFNIVNNSPAAITLDGDLQLYLANPDKDGNYHGLINGQPYTGAYNQTGHLTFSSSPVTIAAGQSKTFAMNSVTIASGDGLGGRSPLDPSKIDWSASSHAQRNVLLYVNKSDKTVLADNLSPDIVFADGATYDIVITDPNTNPSIPTTSGEIISLNFNIVNNSPALIILDGDLQLFLANPDKYGNYHGLINGQPYTGAYNQTGHLAFSSSPVIIAAGQSKTFAMNNVVIAGGEGLGGRSPLDPAEIDWSASSHVQRNVLLYVNKSDKAVLADNLSPDIVFADGATYNIVISNSNKCATPTISYVDGKIKFSCETEGVEYVSELSTTDVGNRYTDEVELSGIITVKVYATKSGYENSDTATAEIEVPASLRGDVNKDGTVNVTDHVELTKIIMNEE